MNLMPRRLVPVGMLAAAALVVPATHVLAAPASAETAAASELLDAFGHHRIVALGQVHDLRQEDEFILRLLRHPRFARTVDSVVVEFGNARFQARVDRYVAGGRMPSSTLKPVWRDLVATGGAMHDGPARFFAAVRQLNRRLPAGRRVRVALGDPAFDWRRLRRASQFDRAVSRRDRVFAAAAERSARGGRRVLLLAGYMHFVRGMPLHSIGETAARILDPGARGRVWTVLPYAGAPKEQEDFERRFITPSRPAAIRPLTGELGSLPAAQLLPAPPLGGGGDPYEGIDLSDVADALISFGPCSELRHAVIGTAPLRDRAYRREVDRRSRIISGRPFVAPRFPAADAPYCPGSGEDGPQAVDEDER